MIFKSAVFKNYSGALVDIQCDVHQGFPGFDIIINSSLSHSQAISQRLRGSIRNQNFKFPRDSVLVQIFPNVPAGNIDDLDLGIVLGIIMSKSKHKLSFLAIGSLDFDGNLRQKWYNLASIVRLARSSSIKYVLMPMPSGDISNVDTLGICISFVKNVKEAVEKCIEIANKLLSSKDEACPQNEDKIIEKVNPFSGIIGLDNAKFAILVAIAGGHNILLVGPRGSGKSMLLSKVANFLPKPEGELLNQRRYNKRVLNDHLAEQSESQVLFLDNQNSQKYLSSNSLSGLIAYHAGYVRIDEIADINHKHMQMLKDILDRGFVVYKDDKYPLHLSVMASINPCPCGNMGLAKSICDCQKSAIDRHLRPLKTSLLTRFEMVVPVLPADFSKDVEKDYTSYIGKIATARKLQSERYGGRALNCDIVRMGLPSSKLASAYKLFNACDNPRDVLLLYSVARTIADLDGRKEVSSDDAELSAMLCKRDGVFEC